tara:strand:+ start:14531 stop:14938 length:408 start_codon:yes stop_codon:yes gene_type:complete
MCLQVEALEGIYDSPNSKNQVDSNESLRADIVNLIASKPITTDQKNVLIDLTEVLISTLTVDLKNERALSAISEELTLAAVCLAVKFEDGLDAHKNLKWLEAEITNTHERAAKYDAYNSARSGSVTRLPHFSSCL